MTLTLVDTGRALRLQTTDSDEVGRLYTLLNTMTGYRYDAGVSSFPAEPRLFEYVFKCTGIKGDASVADWYRPIIETERLQSQLLARPDSRLNHPSSEALYAFQRVSADYIAKHGRVLLSDDCGLGKTAQAVVAADLSTRPGAKLLILCPKSVRLSWVQEIRRWSEGKHEITVLDASDRKEKMASHQDGWVISNYELVRLESWFQQQHWDWLICDEAHRLKNRQTQLYRKVLQLSYNNMLLITGTPYGNNASELWTLLHLLYPDRYPSFWRFFELYIQYVTDFWGTRDIQGIKNSDLLRRDLAPIMVRRSKEEVYSQLPPKVYQTLPLNLNAKQAQFYHNMATEMCVELESGEVLSAATIMSMILRLRQLLSTPANFDLADDSCKLDAAMDVIEGTEKGILAFSLFRATVHRLSERLTKRKIAHAILIGGMKKEALEQAKDDLNSGKIRVLIGTLQTGGEGLHLAGASTVLFIDKHWNPIRQQQAEDRCHRIGQTEKVHIISLHCKDTVDDLVENILNRKIRMQREVLQQSLLETLQGV